MAGHRLTSRLEALERQNGGPRMPAVWLHLKAGESTEDGKARYEAEHGPIGDRYVLVWRPYTGKDTQCA